MTSYAQKMAAELNPNGVKSMVEAFETACTDHSERPAVSCLGHTINFAELDALTLAFANYLIAELGLQKGDRIAVQLPNISQYPVVVWGAWRAGLIVVNTNPMYTAREQLHQFNDSGSVALVVLDKLLPVTEQVLPETPIKHVIVTGVADFLGDDAAFKTNGNLLGFNEVLKVGADSHAQLPEVSMDDIAVLQYTGGTTGPSKGAVLTHSNLYSAKALSRKSIVLNKPGEDEILIAILPLYHVFGFMVNVLGAVIHGGLSIMIPDPRNLDSIIDVMQAYPFTNMAGVNTLLAGLMAHPKFDDVDFSSISGVVVGGTALVKEIGEEWQQRTNTMLYEGYGLSETCASSTCNVPGSNELGTVGRCLDHSEIKLIDADGNTVEGGARGEICIRGPHIMQGYWQRPDATAEAIDADGWFKTGDVGVLQANGHLRIVDRIKDMVIVSGFNVYPNEVEAVVYGHPNVTECGVIGVPNEATGEAIKLFVVSNSPDLTEEEVIQFCRTELTAYKVPKQVVFMDDLPKSPAGKVLRRELRD